MKHRIGPSPGMAASAAYLVAALLAGAGVPAQADEAFARGQIKAMSEYIGTQPTLSFDFDTSLDVITSDDQKLTIASSGSLALERPGKVRAVRRGGFATVEGTFDGTTLSILNRSANSFAQAEVPGTVDKLITYLHDELGRPLPGADLLLTDSATILLDGVTEVQDLGSGVIRGAECDHFAARTPEVDWQIWIAQGEAPYPCRYLITNKAVAGWPQYTLEVSAGGKGAEPAEFAFTPPEGAVKEDIKSIPNLDEIAGIFQIKEAN
jgi:hypothetical protein